MAQQPFVPEPSQRLLEALAGQPDGLTRAELQERAGLGQLDPQAARRFLATLIREGKIQFAGQTRNRRYFIKGGMPAQRETPERDGDFPPLSPEGAQCRAFLAQPPGQRMPVTFSRASLRGAAVRNNRNRPETPVALRKSRRFTWHLPGSLRPFRWRKAPPCWPRTGGECPDYSS